MPQLLLPSVGGLLLMLLMISGGYATAQNEVTLETESELWIEGSSTVNRFSCNATELVGHARLDQAERNRRSNQPIASVFVPVRQFDCGKRHMTQDLHKAMKSSEHPFIRFELDEAHLLEQNESTYHLQATGRLLIAGSEQLLTLTVQADRLAVGRYRARGSQSLSMSDFGIEPPTAMLGLIKAHDEIEVHFDLIANTPNSFKAR